MPTLVEKLFQTRLPPAAFGLNSESATLVELERKRGPFVVKRAMSTTLPDGLVHSAFAEPNLPSPDELGEILESLATQADSTKRQAWSASLPEAATKTIIVTLDDAPKARRELDEMLDWKIERSLGFPLTELQVARAVLPPAKRDELATRRRYMVTAINREVLREYETVFSNLGWQVGLMLPRNIGEGRWLRDLELPTEAPDTMLVSFHRTGLTALILRAGVPLLVRNVTCEPTDQEDELFRFVQFYRDRETPAAIPTEDLPPTDTIALPSLLSGLLVTGDNVDTQRTAELVTDTLGQAPAVLAAEDVGLEFMAAGLTFDRLAAPAGVAAMAWV